MKGWRSKLIFMFILYFAGFATAVYLLAPQPDAEPGQINGQEALQSRFASFDSQEFITSFNSGLHKSVNLGKEAALHMSKYIKEKAKDSELIKSSQNESNT
ncbi:MAG: hypothetical protein JXA96_03375 [Sedimentisphaerales bacterium]|nr:hypothetical protein [Sedimentisphaerales bacterium]